MKFDIKMKGKPSQIELGVLVLYPVNLRIMVYDKEKPKTILWDRTAMNEGTEDLLIKLPLAPNIATLTIMNNQNGDVNNGGLIKITKNKVSKLKRELTENEIHDRYFREFVKFIEKFAYNANYLDTDKTYQSDNGHYAINYVDVIKTSSGQSMTTPARIKEGSGYMQFSKKRISEMTVPEIVAIGLHEFSHNFLNENDASEEEADLNSLITYLGLGFPLVEAYKAWDDIYQYTNTDMNKARSTMVTNLLLDYEKEYQYIS